nr:MAG TPA: deoxyuridine 5'-triphosphate nucleotidohydrolase [Caudoviricetes sp.]
MKGERKITQELSKQKEVVKIDTPELVLVEKLADTERGNGGFGSTGR